MTALCGGGTSSPTVLTAAIVRVTEGAVALALDKYASRWLLPVIPFLGLGDIVSSTFCGTDPPAIPTFTLAESTAVLNLQFGADFTAGIGKLRDAVLAYLWRDLCQCDNGTLPAAPGAVAAPTGTPIIKVASPYVPTGNQGYYRMDHTNSRALTLGCGSPVPPAGWFLPQFDDSAWSRPAFTSLAAGGWTQGYQNGATVGTNPLLAAVTAESLAPAHPPAHNCEQFLLRWTVDLSDITPSLAAARFINQFGAGGLGGWSSGYAYVNGQGGYTQFSAFSWQQIAGFLLPNQRNVLGFHVDSGNTSSANVWGTDGGVDAMLDFTSATPLALETPCCQPDPATAALLASILDMVTLIQRQVAPFAYVTKATHAGLTGAGAIAISGLLGIAATVTVLPGSVGRAGTSPTEYFDMGYLTFGTADGYPHSVRLERDSQIELPPRCSAFTTLAYDLRPGVTVTIKELAREP